MSFVLAIVKYKCMSLWSHICHGLKRSKTHTHKERERDIGMCNKGPVNAICIGKMSQRTWPIGP